MQDGMSRKGAWSTKQLHLLGVPFPLKSGWRKVIIGTKILKSDYDLYVELKDDHLVSLKPRQN